MASNPTPAGQPDRIPKSGDPKRQEVYRREVSDTGRASAERCTIALEASWELACIAEGLVDVAPRLEASDLIVRTFGIRVGTLASVIMSALGDAVVPTHQMRARLTGSQQEEANHG